MNDKLILVVILVILVICLINLGIFYGIISDGGLETFTSIKEELKSMNLLELILIFTLLLPLIILILIRAVLLIKPFK